MVRPPYPDPLTEEDLDRQRQLTTEAGYPVRVLRKGARTCQVSLLTVDALMRTIAANDEIRDIPSGGGLLDKFAEFIEQNGDADTRRRLFDYKARMEEGRAYEQVNGPYSLLRFDHPLVQAMTKQTIEICRQRLARWRAANLGVAARS